MDQLAHFLRQFTLKELDTIYHSIPKMAEAKREKRRAYEERKRQRAMRSKGVSSYPPAVPKDVTGIAVDLGLDISGLIHDIERKKYRS